MAYEQENCSNAEERDGAGLRNFTFQIRIDSNESESGAESVCQPDHADVDVIGVPAGQDPGAFAQQRVCPRTVSVERSAIGAVPRSDRGGEPERVLNLREHFKLVADHAAVDDSEQYGYVGCEVETFSGDIDRAEALPIERSPCARRGGQWCKGPEK